MSQPIRKRIESGIYSRVDPNGKHLGYELQYKDADGKPRRRSIKGDIHAARDQLAAARVRRAGHTAEPADIRTTLGAVIDQYRQTVLPALRPKSRTVYSAALDRASQHLGSRRISQIGRADIRQWIAHMTGDGLKANSVRKYYSVLRAVYTFAHRDLNLPVDFPALRQQDLPDPYDDQRDHRILTDEELAVVLSELTPRDELFFRMLTETGLRASEGLAVTPEAIHGTTLRIRQQTGVGGKPVPLKSRQSRRDIEITRTLAAELRLANGFSTRSYWQIRRSGADAVERSGIEGALPTPHDLRHTHASKLIAAGWDVVEVAKRLGDRIETVLRVYAHEFDARRRSAERQAALEQMYQPNQPIVRRVHP